MHENSHNNLRIDSNLDESNELRRLELISKKVRRGERIDLDEANFLYNFAPLLTLGDLANTVRHRLNPGSIVTFLIDRNINYTNVCNTDCKFCAFYRADSSHPEAYVLSREILQAKIEEALQLGATRILLQGGHNDDLKFDYYLDLVRWIKDTFKIGLNAFSPSEIQQMSKISGKSYISVLSELKSAGLDGLPGGGAEILDDEIRRRVSPKKTKADEWIDIMGIAQSLGLITTASMVIGFGEDISHRLIHLKRLRDLQDRSINSGYTGFNAFISWIVHFNENTSLGRSRHRSDYGASTTEYLKNLALSRIFLDNIPHHQSSWPTLGAEIAQVGLHFGSDDFGSTMMEENVVSQAGAPTSKKWFMSPEELRSHIEDAGFIPAERNSAFEILRVFNPKEEYARVA